MALPGLSRGSVIPCLHGSSAGMITLPESFHNLLTNSLEISISEIENISVSLLLEKDVLHQGFAYKRAACKKTDVVAASVDSVLPIKFDFLNKWQLRYLIIYSHYVIYYRDDTGKKPVGWFSLKDYNRVVRAEEMVSSERKWPFKVIGMRATARTWYFCAASEREMKLWMACFKATMDHAIHGKVKQRCLDIITTEQARCPPLGSSHGDDSITSFSSTGSSMDRYFPDDETYEDLESPTQEGIMEENYDDIVTDDESSGSGSGGRLHPPLGMVTSAFAKADNALYEVNTISGTNIAKRESYFSLGEDYLEIISDTGGSPPSRPVPAPPPRPPPQHSSSSQHSSEMNHLISNLEQQGFKKLKGNTLNESSGLRRSGPDGESFRHRTTDEPHIQPSPVQRPIKPKPPPLTAKPPTTPKPKPLVIPKRTKNLLPESAVLQTSDKAYAETILRKHQHNGMYLLRGSGRDVSKKVLMVWHDESFKGKHYTIFGDQETSFALDQCAQFESLQKLIEYYKSNTLPNTDLKLTVSCPG